MRGKYKRRATFFKKKGNKHILSQEEVASHCSNNIVPNQDNQTSKLTENTKQVTKPNTRSKQKILLKPDSNHENIIISTKHIEKILKLGKNHNYQCSGDLEMKKVRQRLISGTWSIKCNKCSFASQPVHCYEETQLKNEKSKGPRHSTLNLALASSLLNSSINQHKSDKS